MPRARTDFRGGFSLIELVFVIMILSILFAIAAPRLIGNEGRALDLAGEQAADLLAMFAQRHALSSRAVGLWHDADRNQLVLMVLDGDPDDPDQPPVWLVDRTVKPVKLPSSINPDAVTVTADGAAVDVRRWPVATSAGRLRPAIELSLVDRAGRRVTVALPPYSVAPHRYGSDDLALLRVPIDLDAAGRYREDW